MEKTKKPLSHYERTYAKLEKQKVCVENPPQKVLTEFKELNQDTNRVVRKSKYMNVDQVGYLRQFNVSDFALENLLETGVTLSPSGK